MTHPATPSALRETLRKVGLRATSARAAVLRCLIDAARPLTHAEVCELLGDAGFDRATVHRNLNDLAAAGLVRRRDLGDHLWRFELSTGEEAHDETEHAHFICTECGDVECLPEGAIDLRPVRGAPKALKQGKVQIEVRGACNDCK
ncbi:MAG: transcriptional repressor [Sandaracinaceae bacterium]|nr:transcriptional repressor [Sandaracinaceae bacterium]